MRMEDLDPPREPPGAAEGILDSLLAHGLRWDGETLWQSRRHAAYGEAVDALLDSGRAFRCDCSRARLKSLGNTYDGHCRNRRLGPGVASAVRVRVEGDCTITIEDDIQPALTQDVAETVGDFVIRRRDGLYAYQLAVVLDDAWQGVNRVLRGSDLYDSTPRQVYLQRLLGLPTPRYAHIPVVVNAAGQKLSKQTHAPPVDSSDPVNSLRLALAFLGQAQPPATIDDAATLLDAAAADWRLSAVPSLPGIPESALH
jgi:glutamyl-Q tRNA(Asp) synthetase